MDTGERDVERFGAACRETQAISVYSASATTASAILPNMADVAIGPARVGEAEQVLALQYLCYQSEATTYGDRTIPPLTQMLWQLIEEYDAGEVLVARLGGEVVGSVRGRLEGDTCQVGRLIVHPRLQGRGVGTRLMGAIEERFAGAECYELFTGHLSEGNRRLYRRRGYREFREEVISPRLRLVYMRKHQEGGVPGCG